MVQNGGASLDSLLRPSGVLSKKEVANDSKYKIVKNLFMELKNANSNGCNVVINNLHLMFLFFSKNIKN